MNQGTTQKSSGPKKSAAAEELNNKAMQIILHAGDGRTCLNEVIDLLLNDKANTEVDAKIEQAKQEIAKAHMIQTEVIEADIEDEKYDTTLLFTHAQDTLMTISSELNVVKSMIKLYRKLEGKK